MLLVRYIEDERFVRVDCSLEDFEKKVSEMMESTDWIYCDLGLEVYEIDQIEVVSLDEVEI